MNILTYNLCLKPIVFELLKDYLNNSSSLTYSIDFSNTESIYSKNINNFIFCDQRNSKKGLDYDKSNIEYYINKKIVSDFSKIETRIYRLMSRYEKDNYKFNFESRKNHYFDLLKYAFGLIKKYNIQKLIFFDYPHHMESLILFEVAKYLNINTTIISYLYLGEYRLVVDKSIENRFPEFNNPKKLSEFNNINNNYYNKIKNNNTHRKPFYLTENNNLFHLLYFLFKDIYRSFLNGLFRESNNFVKTTLEKKFQDGKFPSEISSSILMFFNRLKIIKLKKIYEAKSKKNIDLSKKFILFCPNLQPEASTLPMAGYYSDYELILDTILEVLPEDYYVYYKEHPLVFNLLKESYLIKNPKFYDRISNKKIIFVDYKEDTFKLIDKSKLVLTPTGSVGLEALIKDKKVAFFGNPWWQKFADPVYIDSPDDLRKLISNKKESNNKNFYNDYIKTFEQTLHWEGFFYDNHDLLCKDLENNLLDNKILTNIKKYIISKINDNN